MRSSLADLLDDIEGAAREAVGFVEGWTIEAFLDDSRTQRAVVMSLIIVGEATARLQDAHPSFAETHPQVPWSVMRATRNKLVHGYFETDLGIVWDTVTRYLPVLREQLPGLRADAASLTHRP